MEEKKPTFGPGDTVKLRNLDGPSLVVESEGYDRNGDYVVHCVFFDKATNDFCGVKIVPAALTMVASAASGDRARRILKKAAVKKAAKVGN